MRFSAWESDWLILSDTLSLISSVSAWSRDTSHVPVSWFICLFVQSLVLILFACFVWSCLISAPGASLSLRSPWSCGSCAWLIIMGPLENVNGDSLLGVLYCQSSDLWTREIIKWPFLVNQLTIGSIFLTNRIQLWLLGGRTYKESFISIDCSTLRVKSLLRKWFYASADID